MYTNAGTGIYYDNSTVGIEYIATTETLRLGGDIVAYATSDERLKGNVANIVDPLSKIISINGVKFTWKDGYAHIHSYTGNDIGVIAQEIEKVLPEVVTERDHGYKAVNYEKLTALLIEGIKELNTKVNKLQERVKVLENK